MFRKKDKMPSEPLPKLPVLTVHYLPQSYEVIDELTAYTVTSTTEAHADTIEILRQKARNIGADAVIGLTFHSGKSHVDRIWAGGVAVRYIDKN